MFLKTRTIVLPSSLSPPLPPDENKPVQLAHLAAAQQRDQRLSLVIEELSEDEWGVLDEKIRKLQANTRGMIARKKVLGLRAERERVRAKKIVRDLKRQAEKDKIANQAGKAANKFFIGSLGFGGVTFLALLIWLHA